MKLIKLDWEAKNGTLYVNPDNICAISSQGDDGTTVHLVGGGIFLVKEEITALAAHLRIMEICDYVRGG